jgi:hypothetical protein
MDHPGRPAPHRSSDSDSPQSLREPGVPPVAPRGGPAAGISGRPYNFVRVATAAWAVAAVAALGALGAYAARPGVSGSPSMHWPSASRVPRAGDRPTLVLFLDARCPCAASSLAELARLLARAPGPVAAFVVASGPSGASATPAAGARLVADPRAEEAGRFGVSTSGHALLFDRGGRLLFSGGITPARGHEGDNYGAEAILARLAGRPARSEAPVFGCPIASVESEESP